MKIGTLRNAAVIVTGRESGTNIYSIGLKYQWKLNKTTFYIYTRCGKPITHEENTNFMNFL